MSRALINRGMFFALLGWAMAGCAPPAREFSGTWRLTRSISNGKEIRHPAALAPTRVFDGQIAEGRRAPSSAGQPYEVSGRARYWVNPNRVPKTIELEYIEGAATGALYHGIYEISGDTMKICVALNGGPAPTDFASPVGSETNLDFYERVRK